MGFVWETVSSPVSIIRQPCGVAEVGQGAVKGASEGHRLAPAATEVGHPRELIAQPRGGQVRSGVAVSGPRKATGCLVEKLSEIKLRLDQAGDGALRRLEALETVSLGIAGKAAPWHDLAAAAKEVPRASHADRHVKNRCALERGGDANARADKR